jgi:hypothetical protein
MSITKLVLLDDRGTPKLIIDGIHPSRIVRHEGVLYISDEEPNTVGPELRSYRPTNALTMVDTSELPEGAKLLYVAARLTGTGEPDGRSNAR